MLRNTLTSLAVAAMAVAALPAGAATMDFVAEAAANEHSFLTETFTNVDGSGIDVTASARLLADNDNVPPYDTTAPYGYLDDLSGGNDGGLGVCPSADCEGSPEDNISLREVAIVEFSTTVEITSISFSNGDHFDVYNGSIGINVGASDPIVAGNFSNIFAAAAVLNPVALIGDRFQFVAPESFLNASTGETYKIYVSSITFEEFPVIPEPSSALLAGMGLLGLLAAGRRTRRA
jgi:hypothetical protein